MSECCCEAVLLGREPVKGTANADSLAGQIRLVTAAGAGALGRKCRLRCSRDGIEIRPAKRQEDEGFESDDDAVSQTSSDSNSSSCFFVEDHVLKLSGPQGSGAMEPSLATDSANSSGASDNDDADNSLNSVQLISPPPPQPPGAHGKSKKSSPEDSLSSRELYSFGDVAFCHTDAGYPKILVLVIRKKSCKEDIQSSTGLEAVIFQCKSVQNVREVCASYKEFSRRLKMDLQFRYPHKRKDSTSSSGALYKNVFDVLQKSMSNSSSPTNSSFFKTSIHHVADKTPSIKEEFPTTDANKKYNLVQRTDGDGVTHIEVSKAVASEYLGSVTTTTTDEFSGSSSIISISTPDEGNLFMSSSIVVPSPSPSFTETSSTSGEIDGVICADIESSLESNLETLRNTANIQSSECNEKFKNTPDSRVNQDTPPKRPQRGKYIKNNTKAKQPIRTDEKSKSSDVDSFSTKAISQESVKQSGNQEKVVRGQFIRVNVEQQQQSPGCSQFSTTTRPAHRLFTESRTSGQMLSYPAWSLPSPASAPSRRGRRAREDETDYRSRGDGSKSYQRRSRSTGGGGGGGPGRRASSPPARPLVYRYIDNLHPKPLSNKVFGKLKEIANINNSCVGTLSRRRNSSGDLSTVQFYTYLEPSLKVSSVSKSTTNLKSVIKKKNCSENLEPKKVTFSAYATVQVVD